MKRTVDIGAQSRGPRMENDSGRVRVAIKRGGDWHSETASNDGVT